MNFYSQAGQDQFAWALVKDATERNFMDIGCGGLEISNTIALERAGFDGWCIDNSQEAFNACDDRKVCAFLGDATQFDYWFLPAIVSFLSLDVDQYSFSALCQLPLASTRFRVIAAEHDFYSRGESLRSPMISLLKNSGYDILCADVCHEGKPFEIWAVHPELVDMNVANKFRRDKPTDWKEILGL